MNKNIIVSILVIALAATMIGGVTMAWFTDTTEQIVNEFTAGTVEISAGEIVFPPAETAENWNPGDCADKVYELINTGTKGIYLRAKISGQWYLEGGETEWTPDPDLDVVTWTFDDGWELIEDEYGVEHLYYKESIAGTFNETPIEDRTVTLTLNVCLDGPNTGNQYQGKVFKLMAEFQAVQSSNYAVHDVWGPGLGHIYDEEIE